jgi:hypothetical protein
MKNSLVNSKTLILRIFINWFNMDLTYFDFSHAQYDFKRQAYIKVGILRKVTRFVYYLFSSLSDELSFSDSEI